MNEQERKFIALTARMEGESIVVRNIGKKIKVSEMELVVLCNFAEIGLLSLFSGLDGEVGDEAYIKMDSLLEEIRKTFANESNNDGLQRLSKSAVAMLLVQKRFRKYILNYQGE